MLENDLSAVYLLKVYMYERADKIFVTLTSF